MCRVHRGQRGLPMDDAAFSAMSEEERFFWIDFFEEAKLIIGQKTAAGEEQPFDPPLSLKRKHQKALRDYEGAKYCQIQQLQDIFVF